MALSVALLLSVKFHNLMNGSSYTMKQVYILSLNVSDFPFSDFFILRFSFSDFFILRFFTLRFFHSQIFLFSDFHS